MASNSSAAVTLRAATLAEATPTQETLSPKTCEEHNVTVCRTFITVIESDKKLALPGNLERALTWPSACYASTYVEVVGEEVDVSYAHGPCHLTVQPTNGPIDADSMESDVNGSCAAFPPFSDGGFCIDYVGPPVAVIDHGVGGRFHSGYSAIVNQGNSHAAASPHRAVLSLENPSPKPKIATADASVGVKRKRRGGKSGAKERSKFVAQENAVHDETNMQNPETPQSESFGVVITLAELFQSCPNPVDILKKPATCKALVKQLEAESSTPKELITYLLPALKAMALHVEGCRVVQKMLENGGLRESHIAEILVTDFEELYDSPCGNHVLTKAIAMLPAASLKMLGKVQGQATTMAKHRYGCRVLERLTEFAKEEDLDSVYNDIIADAKSLCRHPYGNFVIQKMLERVEWSRPLILQEMLDGDGGMPYLASHRTASHVVQKALEWCDTDGQHKIVNTLLTGQGEYSLLYVATSRYGSFVIEQIDGVRWSCEGLVAEVEAHLRDSQETLRSNKHGERVAKRFGLKDLQAAVDSVQ